MAGLLSALSSGRSSLEVSQKSIEITGNNISNVNTEGYSRQKADLATYPAVSFGNFFVGQGVKITDVSRDHDVFIDQQIKQKAIDFGLQDAVTVPLAELERVFGISEDNLSADIDNFFDSLQELSANPSDLVQRNNVILQGEMLATSFNDTVKELDTIKESINETILSKLDTVNSLISEIADLNERIYNIEIHGQTANSARDQRDLAVKSLAQTIGAQSYENKNGMLSVTLPGGLPLVIGDMAMTITSQESGSDLQLQLNAGGGTRDIGLKNLGGEFQGLMDIRDNFIPELSADLDKLAHELTTQVNAQHSAGGGLDDSTGLSFFSDLADSTDAARLMKVEITDPTQIAAGADPGSGSVASGDNSNALALASIGVDSFNSLYGKISAKVGLESSQNQLSLSGAEDALNQLENFRDSLVGVSLEEEMINLIQFQRGFESSAKFLSTVDEMMITILNIKQ